MERRLEMPRYTLALLVACASQLAGGDRHWSFVRPERPTLPAVERTSWARNPIDLFVLARLEAASVGPSPEADRSTLLRRLSLDLIGLPPNPQDIEEFLASDDPRSYERLVDRYLSSPQFGERWGRHWLDLARYADSNGYEDDRYRPDAWRYRDWVVDAINADQPFDAFTVEQIAGDLVPDATYEQKVATGFHRMCPSNEAGNPAVKEEFRVKTAKERVETVSDVWLGLTAGCAQCHAHKYDPISQREYYELFAFFNAAVNVDIDAPPLPRDYWINYERAKKEFKGHPNNAPQPPSSKALTIASNPEPPKSYVHERGDFLAKGQSVSPRTPAFLAALTSRSQSPDRLDLARWIASEENPLTARVAVNHIWQHLFGTGLVKTPEDFGTQGVPPTHPLLLDWLAVEFVQRGWNRKSLIRLIVTSSTYRQSSRPHPELARADPENKLLSRQNRLRLEAEIIRDLALAVSGLLEPRLGGPSVQPRLPAGLAEMNVLKTERFREEDKGADVFRRGLYTNVQRTLLYPAFETLDVADPNVSCAKRDRSTSPRQALALLNERAFFECARALGLRLAEPPGAIWETRLHRAFLLCLGRIPTTTEHRVLEELFEGCRDLYTKAPAIARELLGTSSEDASENARHAAWIGVARTLLNLEEFITRE